jgi:hypothetical protein
MAMKTMAPGAICLFIIKFFVVKETLSNKQCKIKPERLSWLVSAVQLIVKKAHFKANAPLLNIFDDSLKEKCQNAF